MFYKIRFVEGLEHNTVKELWMVKVMMADDEQEQLLA